MAQAQTQAAAQQTGSGNELAYGVTHDAAAYSPAQRRISPMPVGSGAALSVGVADGDTGALVAAVGVGTGGSVSVGTGAGEPAGAEALGRTAAGPVADAREPDAREVRDV
jgi:hypothetical protein